MGRGLLALLVALCCTGASWAAGLRPPADRQGYAVDDPRIFALQRLFGIAHGVSLLAADCLDSPTHSEAVQNAYAPWRAAQDELIATAERELALFYFDARADEAGWQEIAAALGLPEQFEPSRPRAEREAACATFAAALARPRYDLARQFRLHAFLAEATATIEAEMMLAHCRTRLAPEEARLLKIRYSLWQEINAGRAAAARAALEADWPVEAPAASLAQWRDQLQRGASVRGGAEACRDFSARLKDPRFALRNLFAPSAGIRP